MLLEKVPLLEVEFLVSSFRLVFLKLVGVASKDVGISSCDGWISDLLGIVADLERPTIDASER